MSESRSSRSSAALILGALAGVMAALTVLPTWIPVTLRLTGAEEAIAALHTESAAELSLNIAQSDEGLREGTLERLTITHLSVVDSDGNIVFAEGRGLPPAVAEVPCDGAGHIRRDANGARWAVACRSEDNLEVRAAWAPAFTSTWDITLLVWAMASLAGIITALMVLRLLKPLSLMSEALDQLSAGARAVRVEQTGFVELDELVERLNAASEAMEQREDAILARIQVVQQMARLVAHEIRNPLQSLELLSTLMIEEESVAERADIAAAIHNEIRALDQVVTRLLRDGSAGGGLQLRPSRQSLGPTLRSIVQLRRMDARQMGIQIELAEVTETPCAFDVALVGRSVENLIVNAVQAAPHGYGVVRVSAQEEPDAIAIVVEDNGEGVDEELADRIFETNVTTKRQGTGLGLALVKGVFEAHGGSILYDKSPYGGARFIARLPLHEVPVDPAQGLDRR